MSENAWDEREKELKERLNYAHEHNSSDEVILATRLLQFQSCRSLHESDLKRLFDEIEKEIKRREREIEKIYRECHGEKSAYYSLGCELVGIKKVFELMKNERDYSKA